MRSNPQALLLLATALLPASPGHAQSAPAHAISLTLGPRLGLTDYAFTPTDTRHGWQSALQAQPGYSAGGFAEASVANGALRLRTDVSWLTHRQRYQLGNTAPTRTDLHYRATEVSCTPTLLLRVGRLPLYVLGGVEINRGLSSRVSGRYLLADTDSPTGYQFVTTDQPYRSPHTTDVRPTLGLSALIRHRFDLTFRVAWGGRFQAYAPHEAGLYEALASMVTAFWTRPQSPVYPTEADFREMRFIGNQLSVGYRFGAAPAGKGPWRTPD